MERTRRFDSMERSSRSIRSAFMVGALLALLAGSARAQEEAPSAGAPDDAPRSRLTLRGEYVVETFSQSFHLGAAPTGGISTNHDAFWAQNLLLRPRFIISDDLNVNVSLDVAQGIWGLETGTSVSGDPYPVNPSLTALRVDWAYLAYRHDGSGTRWYVGRQPFVLGQGLVLETDAAGLQVYRDFSRLGSLGIGVAKIYEAGGFSDENNLGPDSVRVGHDGRDADLFFASLETGSERFSVRPYFVYYQDRSGGDGITVFPDRVPYLETRFQPNVTRATAFGASAELRRGVLQVDAEYDKLRGTDRIKNASFGPFARNDINSGDLTGGNLYFRAALVGGRAELGLVYAKGTGDPDPRSGEGNLNRIATDGGFSITEVWEDSIMPDRGYYPAGMGSPLVRGYRDLENSKILQGFVAYRPRASLRLFGSVSVIRSTEVVREWSDANGDGLLAVDEFGSGVSNELGSEFDFRIDWLLDRKLQVELALGRFLPRVASSYLLYGHGSAQDPATEIRARITVPIPEFSLGG